MNDESNQYSPGLVAPNRAMVLLLATAGVESEITSVASVANQRNTTLHAYSPTAAHRCDPFSHPFNPFNPYPKV
jgi:hypothetical protein